MTVRRDQFGMPSKVDCAGRSFTKVKRIARVETTKAKGRFRVTHQKHHFIPEFYLSQWTSSPANKLIEYKIVNSKLIPKLIGAGATGYERNLYEFDELPPESAQHLEKEFFNYTDNTASQALQLNLSGANAWTPELTNAWSRFILGISLRHPDAIPELKAAAKAIWNRAGSLTQQEYEKIKKPDDPQSFKEFLLSRDELGHVKVRVNMIVHAFDNEPVISHINRMNWAVADVTASPHKLLTSDRPVCFYNLKKSDGMIFFPISPTKLFIAANEKSVLGQLKKMSPQKLTFEVNTLVVGRARRFVWASDQKQGRFIQNRMSKNMEPVPLYPELKRFSDDVDSG